MGTEVDTDFAMKDRPRGFLAQEQIDHTSEQFDYIVELHVILWRFIQVETPGACGKLNECLPTALAKAEKRAARRR